MKKWRKKKKAGFFTKYARRILSAKFIAIMIALVCLSATAGGFAVYEKTFITTTKAVPVSFNPASPSVLAASSASTLETFFESSTTSSPVFSPVDLSYDMDVYVYSKKKHVCNDYKNVYKSSYFSTRCKVADGVWRGHLVKKIDVAGFSKLRVKAGLGVKDYSNYFSECNYRGINRDDFVTLMALSYDINNSFRWDCNHEVAEEKWSMCQVKKTDPGVLAYCNVPMCSNSVSCDFEIDVAKQSAVYLLFSANDAWLADVEGSISNVEYSLIK